MGLLNWFFGGGGEEEDVRECPACDGAGETRGLIFTNTCKRCDGTGEVIKRRGYDDESSE